MGLPRVKREKIRKTIILKESDSITQKFLLPEIKALASNTLLEENRKQANIENSPTAIRVDSNYAKIKESEAKKLASIDNVVFVDFRKKAILFYTSNETLKQAVEFAWNRVRELTSKRSGFAVSTYYMWVSAPGASSGFATDSLNAVFRWIDRVNSPLASIRILGPTVQDRRKRIYSPSGSPATSKWVTPSKAGASGKEIPRWKIRQAGGGSKIYRTENNDYLKSRKDSIVLRATGKKRRNKPLYRALVGRALQETVVRAVKRQYRDIWTGYGFTKSKIRLVERRKRGPNAPSQYGQFIPEIYIGVKKIGRR